MFPGRSVLFAVLIAAASVPVAVAQDAPPPQPSPPTAPDPRPAPEKPLARVAELVKRGQWKYARDALTKLLADYEGDDRLRVRLAEVEDHLQRCVFQTEAPKPDLLASLRRGATKFDAQKKLVTFTPADLDEEHGWSPAGGNMQSFDVPFTSEVTVECDLEYVLLFWTPSAESAYAFDVGGATTTANSYYPRAIYRMTAGSSRLLAEGPLDPQQRPVGLLRASRAGNNLVMALGGKTVVKTTDSELRGGLVAVRAARPRAGWKSTPPRVTITGRVDPEFAARALAEAESAEYRVWLAKVWPQRREKDLPAWIRSTAGTESKPHAVPADCPEDLRGAVAQLSRDFFDRAWERVVASDLSPSDLPAATRLWVRGLHFSASGLRAEAVEDLTALAESSPDFAPARAALGLALLWTGERDRAAAVLAEARTSAADFAPTWDALAELARFDDDPVAWRAALDEAARRRLATARTAKLRALLERFERGPAFSKRFQSETPNFVLVSDVSKEACDEAAKVLELAVATYQEKFRPRKRPGKSRVYLFAGRQSYESYASDLGRTFAGTAGVYLLDTRELCIWLHDDREDLWDTVRHEAFHQYVHSLVDEVPIWFDEGYAEYFGASRRTGGVTATGQVSAWRRETLARIQSRIPSLKALALMKQPEFMEKADVHYPVAWAAIHMMLESGNAKHRRLLREYFDAVLRGADAETAWKKVLAPEETELEDLWARHLGRLIAGK